MAPTKRGAQAEYKPKMDAARKRVEKQNAQQQQQRAAATGSNNYTQQVVERDFERERAEQRSVGRMLLSADDLRDGYGIRFSKVQLWKLVKLGQFPAPIKMSANRNAWVRSEIEAWIAVRMRERDAGAA